MTNDDASECEVLVTGATGFVGAQVAGQLASQGHEVVALSRRPPGPAVAQVAGKVQWLHDDLLTTDLGALAAKVLGLYDEVKQRQLL